MPNYLVQVDGGTPYDLTAESSAAATVAAMEAHPEARRLRVGPGHTSIGWFATSRMSERQRVGNEQWRAAQWGDAERIREGGKA